MTGGWQHTNQCQTAHPPAYDQWNLTVYYLCITREPLMKGLIVSDRVWSARRLFWNVNWRRKERAPWRSGMQWRKGDPTLWGDKRHPSQTCVKWGLMNPGKIKKRYEKKEDRGEKALSFPSVPPSAHPCLSDHHLPPLFCQRPSWWLLSEVRISFVVWCFAAATVEMPSSSAYAQVGRGGIGGEERVLDWKLARHGCLWYLLILTHLWESESKGQKKHFPRNSGSRVSERRDLGGGTRTRHMSVTLCRVTQRWHLTGALNNLKGEEDYSEA